MKILIAADMEGITGVVHWDQVDSSHPEYARFRRLMTGDVNAAIRGAFQAGADEVIVADGHGYSRNILIEELDQRAHLNSGTPSPLSMVQGIDSGVNGVIYVGYHARIGSQNAILDHTWSDVRVANLWINGALFGEIGLNAAVCGHFGAPVIMISGDQTACAEAETLLGPLEKAVVKRASGRMSAELYPPAVTQLLIQDAAARAVANLRQGQSPQPLRLPTPITMVIDFPQSEMADKAACLPGSQRSGRRLAYTAPDIVTIYAAFRTVLALAR
ncbi:MAG: M55 family metallopeptidase [Chloroflexota bacterium]